MTANVQTVSHDLSLGIKFGSTPEHEIPSPENKSALEVLGEGVLLLLFGERDGKVIIYTQEGEVTLSRGPVLGSLTVTGR